MEMMTLHLLILEDNPDDAELAVKELERKGFDVKWTRVDTEEAFRKALSEKPDLILADYFVPSFDAMAALQMYRQLKLEIPLIIFSGTIGEEVAVECMKSGATDYVLKDNLSRLCPVVKRALEEMKTYRKSKQAEEALRESEERFDAMLQSIGDHMSMMDKDLNIIWANEIARKIFGDNIVGKKCFEAYHKRKEPCKPYPCLTLKSFQDGKIHEHDTQVIDSNGEIRYFHCTANVALRDKDGKPVAVIEISRDITKRKQAEEEIRKLSSAVEQSIDGVAISDLEAKLTYVNCAFARMHGYSPEEMIGIKFVDLLKKEELDKYTNGLNKVKTLGSWTCEIEHIRKDATSYPTFMSVNLLKDAEGKATGVQAVVRDISEQKKLEEQFRQAQKMEAVGTLAGGVAHDFNNLLTVIIGNAELALMDVIKDESLRKGIEETKKAGEKAASLTRQLLAFSRKQVIMPEVIDLNKGINETKNMLKRTIGEDIEFLTVLEPELWKAYADSGQIDQVIMNMVVNARDVMPQGGKLIIETANVDLDKNYFCERGIEGEKSGHYVMLTVSDTGKGMDKEIQEHIFEPFFTTKEVGKGTGLGLSTIYGIVKQNDGFIWVYSEPGKGTTFKVYLPRVKGDMEPEEKEQTSVAELGGSETVLIVEDDDSLRNLAQKALRQHGYKVLVAENGENALKVGKEHDGQIDLMITDVVMPKMGGREAAERLQPLYPQMKVIYMSGYTDNAIVHHAVLEPGLNYFEKPFTPEGLARKVREALKSEN